MSDGVKRGGLSDDPEIRRRQLEGLERGRQVSAARREAGLPSKKKERELEQRVIEGGQRGGTRQRPTKETPRGATTKTKRQQPKEEHVDEAGVSLPWYAPAYTGRRNRDFLAGLSGGADDGDPDEAGSDS